VDFALSESHVRLAETVREFGEREIRPHAAEWEARAAFPHDAVRKLGAMGLLGLTLPPDVGGGGADVLSGVLLVEGIARYDASLGLTVASHTGLASGHLNRFANDALRRRFLPRMASGEWLGAWCLTEPGSGSDASALRTRAVRDGDHWVLDGTKMFITQGSVGHVYVVLASTDPAAGQRGISAFVVPRDAPGLSNGRRIEKLGLHASDTAEVVFEHVRVPADHLIGEENQGFKQALAVLDGGRVGIAAWCCGIGRGALEDAAAFVAAHRSVVDQAEAVATLGEMSARLDAARVLIFRAAHLRERGRPFQVEASMAKLTASEAAMFCATQAVTLAGAAGATRALPLERHLRDAKLGEIGEGTSEVQRLVIARALLRDALSSL